MHGMFGAKKQQMLSRRKWEIILLCENLEISDSSLGNSGRKTVTGRGLNENLISASVSESCTTIRTTILKQ